ncbi:MAG: hypothetical protein NC089_05625 [Bacteroides sp.]|nr:hypothetical protein [Bacteroides sp.]MCM1549032.1 hypothetical protein [Clostridium sp.]
MNYPLPDIQFDKEQKYIIYGTGDVAKNYYEQLVKIINDDVIYYFIESVRKQDFLYGRKVLLPSELNIIDKNSYKYILATFSSADSMEGELLRQGISNKNIIKCEQYSVDAFDAFLLPIKKNLLYPFFSDAEQLQKMVEEFEWYVPELHEKDIVVEYHCLPEIKDKIADFLPTYFCYIENIEIEDYDLVLIWNKEFLTDTFINLFANKFCIDSSFYRNVHAKILTRLNYKISEKDWDMVSKQNYRKIEAMCNSETRAFVFGAGPSFEEGSEKCRQLTHKCDIRIVCSGCIFNECAMEQSNPNLYLLADVFYVTREYKAQLDLVVNWMINHKGFLIVHKWWMPLLAKRYHGIESILIGMDESATEIRFPDSELLSVCSKAHNVITKYAIPIASALAQKIYVSGCDGVKMVGNSFEWDHCDGMKYTTEQSLVLDHYGYFEELLKYGEALGKEYVPLTTSHIPALQERFKKR